MRSYTRTIAANDGITINTPGGAHEVYVSEGDADVTLIPDGDSSPVQISIGMGLRYPRAFVALRIESVTAQTITVVIGDGSVFDNRATITGASITGGKIEAQAAATVTDGAATANTVSSELVAANASRSRLVIQNIGSSTVYLGDSGVTVANGLKVLPGAQYICQHQEAVHAITSTGTADCRYSDESVS